MIDLPGGHLYPSFRIKGSKSLRIMGAVKMEVSNLPSVDEPKRSANISQLTSYDIE